MQSLGLENAVSKAKEGATWRQEISKMVVEII